MESRPETDAAFEQRKRVRVTYNGASSCASYQPKKSFRFLAREPIPIAKHDRSQLLHLANVMLEELLTSSPEALRDLSKAATPEQARQLKQFSDRLADHVLRQHSLLSRRHRMLAWVVRLRAGLVVRKCLGEWPKDYGSLGRLGHVQTLELLVSDRPVPAYTLAEFWRSLKLLVERLDTIKHHEQIEYYVHCLEMCCAKFTLVRSDNRSLFDYNPFCAFDSTEKLYSVNEAFFEETERLFHGLHERFDTYRKLSWHTLPRHAAPAAAVRHLHAKLSSKSQGPFVEFIERDLSQQIYEWHVLIGERERYEREETFGDPTGRNIIAKWRPDQVDRCVEMLARSKVVQAILDRLIASDHDHNRLGAVPVPPTSPPPPRHDGGGGGDGDSDDDANMYADIDLDMDADEDADTSTGTDADADVDLNGLVLIVLNYIFDEILTVRTRRFAQRFVLRAQALHSPTFHDDHHLPLIVQVYNEYAVYFDGRARYRGDFAACFIEWVRVVCEESTWKGRLPNEPPTVNLLFLYEGLFRDRDATIARLAGQLTELALGHAPPELPLPAHYTDGGGGLA